MARVSAEEANKWLEELTKRINGGGGSWGPNAFSPSSVKDNKEQKPDSLKAKDPAAKGIPLKKNSDGTWEGKPVTIEGTYRPEKKKQEKTKVQPEPKVAEPEEKPAKLPGRREIETTIIKGSESRELPPVNSKMRPERSAPAVKAHADRMDSESLNRIESRGNEVREALKKQGPKDLTWEEIEAYLAKGKEDDKKAGPDLLAAALISLVPTVVGGMVGGLGGAAKGAEGGAKGNQTLIDGYKEKTKTKQDDRMKALELRHKIADSESKRIQQDKELLVKQAGAEYQAFGRVLEPTKKALMEAEKADALAVNQAEKQDDQQDFLGGDREDKQAHIMDKQGQDYAARIMEGNLRGERDATARRENHDNKMTHSEKQNNFQTGKMTNEQAHQFELQRQRHKDAMELQKNKPKAGAKGNTNSTAKFGEEPIPGYRWNGKTNVSAAEIAKLRKATSDVDTMQSSIDAITTFITKTPKQRLVASPTVQDDLKALLSEAYFLYKNESFANLGVINGPDLDLLNSVIQNPSDFKKLIQDPKAIIKRYEGLMSRLQGGVENKLYRSGFVRADAGPTRPSFNPASSWQQGGGGSAQKSLKHGYEDGETKFMKGFEWTRKNGVWIKGKAVE